MEPFACTVWALPLELQPFPTGLLADLNIACYGWPSILAPLLKQLKNSFPDYFELRKAVLY